MPDKKSQLPSIQKSMREEMIDAIIGIDEEMDDDTAREILESYGLNEDDLLAEFKQCIRVELRNIDPATRESENLGKTLKNINDFQNQSSPYSVVPKDWVSGMLNKLLPESQTKPLYSFHNRNDGEMSDHDKKILDDLEDELKEE